MASRIGCPKRRLPAEEWSGWRNRCRSLVAPAATTGLLMPPLIISPSSFPRCLPFPSHAADKIRVLSSAMSVVAGLFPWCRPRKCGRRSQKIHERTRAAMAFTATHLPWRNLRSRCAASIADKSTGNFLIRRTDSSTCLTGDCHGFAKDFFRAFVAALLAVDDFWGPALACRLSHLADAHFHARNLA